MKCLFCFLFFTWQGIPVWHQWGEPRCWGRPASQLYTPALSLGSWKKKYIYISYQSIKWFYFTPPMVILKCKKNPQFTTRPYCEKLCICNFISLYIHGFISNNEVERYLCCFVLFSWGTKSTKSRHLNAVSLKQSLLTEGYISAFVSMSL